MKLGRQASLILVLLGAAAGAPPGAGFAAPAEVPAELQATIIARLLAYDRALKQRAGADVNIAVLFESGNAASTGAQTGMIQAFGTLKSHSVQGLPVTVAPLAFKDAAALAVALAGVDVLYVPAGFGGQLPVIRRACADRKVICLGPSRDYAEQGLAIAVVPKGDKPHILINKTAADSLGMDLDPKLLQLAELLR